MDAIPFTLGQRSRQLRGLLFLITALGGTWIVADRIVSGSFDSVIMTGLAISLVAALLLSRLLTSVLYEISGTDPLSYVGAASLLLAIGAVASFRPAWKAAIVDPMHTLRAE